MTESERPSDAGLVEQIPLGSQGVVPAKGHLSHHQVDMGRKCGVQLLFYLTVGPVPPGAAAIRGSSVAKAAKADLEHVMATGEHMPVEHVVDAALTAFRASSDMGYRIVDDDRAPSKVLGDERDITAAATRAWRQKLAPKTDPAYVEKPITVRLDGVNWAFKVIPDYATKDGILGDLKTRTKFAPGEVHESEQLTYGAMAHSHLTGALPRAVALDVVAVTKASTRKRELRIPTPTAEVEELPDGKVVTTDRLLAVRDIEDIQRALNAASAVARMIETGAAVPAPIGAWWCSRKWCGWWERCPYASLARDRAARSAPQYED